MPVTLDNIQFYDGPSKPPKPPHFALNGGWYCTGVFPSSERPIFSQTTGCPLTSRSTASHANNQKHRQTAVLPNVFDIELGKNLEEDLAPLAKDAALEDASCDSLPTFDLGHQEDFDRDLSLDPPFSARVKCVSEPGDTGPSKNPSPVRPSSSNSPLVQNNHMVIVRPDSANLIGNTKQSTEVEVAQQSEETFPRRYPSSSDECVSPEVSTSVCERSTETSPPSQSVSPAAELSKEDSFLSPASEDHIEDEDDTHQYAGKEAMSDSDSCSVTTTLSSSPEQVTPERADTAEAMDLKSPFRSKSLCIPDEFTTTNSKKRERGKRRNESEKTSKKPCQKGKYPSVTVVIPPLRARTIQSARSNSQSVSSNISLSGDSEGSDDSSDEDYTRNNLQSGLTDKESIQVLGCKHSRSGTAASYEFQGSRDSLLDCHNTSRDITGRAILTIESEGRKPTFFLTIVPDDIPPPTHLSANCIHEAMAPSSKRKQPVTKSRGSQAKGKRPRYSPNEDYLLVKLKEQERLTWGEIRAHFPGRKLSSLQVHYSSKLKHRSTGQPRPRTKKRKRK